MAAPVDLSLATPRLRLRPVLDGEPADALARLSAHVHEEAEPDRVSPARSEHARRVVARSAAAFAAHGFGLWLLVPHGARDPVGWCGLKAGDDPAEPELMFGLLPAARGTGLATEAVRAVVAWARALPRTRRVWGAARPGHLASLKVMERAGLRDEGRRTLDGEEYDVYCVATPEGEAERVSDAEPADAARKHPIRARAAAAAATVFLIWSYQAFGAAALLPIVVAVATALILTKAGPERARPFRLAIGVLLGHVASMVAAAIMSGGVGLIWVDGAAILVGTAWLVVRPGLAPVLALAILEVISIASHAWQLTLAAYAGSERVIAFHVSLRLLALAALAIGYVGLRKHRTTVTRAALARTFE